MHGVTSYEIKPNWENCAGEVYESFFILKVWMVSWYRPNKKCEIYFWNEGIIKIHEDLKPQTGALRMGKIVNELKIETNNIVLNLIFWNYSNSLIQIQIFLEY